MSEEKSDLVEAHIKTAFDLMRELSEDDCMEAIGLVVQRLVGFKRKITEGEILGEGAIGEAIAQLFVQQARMASVASDTVRVLHKETGEVEEIPRSSIPKKVERSIYFEVDLKPGEVAIIEPRVDDDVKLFRGQRLFMEESVLNSTGLIAFIIGNKLQMPLSATIDGVSAMFFSRDLEVDNEMVFDTLEAKIYYAAEKRWMPGYRAQMIVRNRTDQTARWSAEIKGLAILVSENVA